MLLAGTVVDDTYVIETALGMGGYGAVYKAEHRTLARPVALKMLHEHVIIQSEAVSRFKQEAEILNALKHRNLVMFYGFGLLNGSGYIAMEYVSGRCLQTMLNSGPLSVGSTLRIMAQVCEALACAHANGVIHRDLKPSNILVTESGTVKVIDFGLAKVTREGGAQAITQEGFTVGSAEYMSPEQCSGQPLDYRGDIYSFGCILYRCLAGQPPFVADDATTVMNQHVLETPAPLAEFFQPGSLPEGLEETISRCLAKDPCERFQSTGDLLGCLRQIAASHGSSVTTAAYQRKGDDQKPQRRWLVALPVAATILCIAVAAWNVNSSQREPALTSVDYYSRARRIRAYKEVDHASRMRLTHETINWYEKALQMDQVDHLLSQGERLRILRALADFLYDTRSFDRAAVRSLEAIRLGEELRDFGEHRDAHMALTYSGSMRQLNRPLEALPVLQKMLSHYPAHDNNRLDVELQLALTMLSAGMTQPANVLLEKAAQNPYARYEQTALARSALSVSKPISKENTVKQLNGIVKAAPGN